MKYHSIVVLIVAVLLLSCQGANDRLYDQLDAHLLRKEEVLKRKDQQLDSLKHLLDRCHDVEGRYAIHEQLYQQYLLFHADSAMKYIQLAMDEARQLDRQDYLHRCQLFQAYILATVGHYNEAEDVIKNVPKEHLNAADSITYYETFRWIYNVWEAYIKDEQHAQKLGTMTEKTNGQLQ